ncbi:16S rRNA (guanine(527)-N(7))-methyltransferase RsmG [Deinococcus sp.]|uniref:16S rRNA (guanine(527)-N(7))-methyltransferase RsmG n=1 Tax=Deinococcus sp. TaxID=47478 RepID=UPI0025BB6461|nr:16S rRNA (guanine(527)-N(7))-methyltransferase RsmG [Deinococcus sp.]
MTPEGLALLQDGAGQLKLELTPEQLSKFEQLYILLLEGNHRLNLTALRQERDIVLKHFVDSLSCLRGGHLGGDLRVLDLGTGGGFPALPLAIMRPELHLIPLDSTRKKIDFVRETAAALGLDNVTPLVGRAEQVGRLPDYREQLDRVVVRAVAALPVLVELALPLLRVGGQLVAQKGALGQEELGAGQQVARELRGEVIEVDSFGLPILGDERTLVVVRKDGRTPEKYPRREGVPTTQPLFWKVK